MLEITEHLLNILKYDATLTSLTGASGGDYRVYSWNPPFDIIFSTTYKAAIFYYFNASSRRRNWSYPSQIGDITYFFQSISPNKTTSAQIMERIRVLFDNYSFSTDSYNILSMVCVGANEGPIEGTPTKKLFGYTTSFLLKEIFEK